MTQGVPIVGMFQDFLGAVMGQESNGNYKAVNRNTGALGLYQVMPSNVGPWGRQYLGRNISPQQFLNNPTLQTQLVTAVMRDYVNRYGYRGAASAWYSGNPNLANHYGPQKFGPSIGSYVDSVMDRMRDSAPLAAFGPAKAMIDIANQGMKQVKQSFAEQEAQTPEPKPLSEMAKTLIAPSESGEDESPVTGGLGIESPLGPDGEGSLGLEALGIESPTGREVDDPLAQELGLSSQLAMVPVSESVRETPTRVEPGVPRGSTIGGDFALRNPLPGFRVTFGFGEHYGSTRSAGDIHKGIDFAAPSGTRVHAPEGARIISAGWENTGFGLAIRYQAADGTFGILGHLSSIDPSIKAGAFIKAGGLLGRVGSTGDSSGAHLHWEKRRKLYDIRTAYDFTDSVEW